MTSRPLDSAVVGACIVSLLAACRDTAAHVGTGDPVSAAAPSASSPFAAQAPDASVPGARDEVVELLSGLGVRLDHANEQLEIRGWVNMQRGLVEVFACTPQGKTHESVIVLDCVPSGLHAGLLALGVQPGTPAEIGTDGTYRAPTGDPVDVLVHWTAADGKPRSARAEDWVWDHAKQRAMPRGAWIFAGSFLQPAADASGASAYAANYIKSLMTTYHDATSVLENPWPEGNDDTVYYVNEAAVPDVGTPVTVEFRAARGGT